MKGGGEGRRKGEEKGGGREWRREGEEGKGEGKGDERMRQEGRGRAKEGDSKHNITPVQITRQHIRGT